MSYQRINNLTGWAVFAISLLVYLLTMAPTASFWDCGEFIACANELEVTHPPGAPLFLMMGRIFAMLALDPTEIAFMVNFMSALAGAFTATFTCWITTTLAKKTLVNHESTGQTRTFLIMAAGFLAGLACTFADSVWFNSVEAEVYSMSSFFTAIVVWLIFKWEERADEPDHLRWLILIAYIMGLSIGVHLLNLLTIPALAMVYYFRKHEVTWKGVFITLGISVAVLAFIQYGIIQYTFSIAWGFEQLFTGTINRAGTQESGWGLPMGTGSLVFATLLFGTIIAGLWWSYRNRKVILHTSLLALSVIMIGFSSYAMIFIRSGVNPPIDMNNPENILTFLSYMKREQYGDRPLLRGPLYNGQIKRDSRGYPVEEDLGMKYIVVDGSAKYVEDVPRTKYEYRDKDIVWFPRMYEPGRYNSGPFGYRNYVKDLGQDPNNPNDDRPTKGEDIRFFFEYQLYHMYIRYFLWNFVGRESDIQEARWESGLEPASISPSRYTPEQRDNKGKNHFFFLPLLFGMLGLIWQATTSKKDAAIIGMLFFFTGVAIVIYLNQYPAQPRERDYSYAGSFQTFCIWIGLGVLFLYDLLKKYLGGATQYAAAGLVFLAPLLMAVQGWDDHTRKGRWIDIEFAKNLLDSCEKDGILFTGGDNDTFPLWYVQEVEGYRTDVRVVNLELLISDWYIDQMKDQKNDSPPLPISMEKAEYAGERNIVIRNFRPHQLAFPVDRNELVTNGVISTEQAAYADSAMVWDFKGRGGQVKYLLRKDSVMANIVYNVANDGWKRPIYFANTMNQSNFLNLQDYLRTEGLAYRLVPIKKSKQTPNDPYFGWVDLPRSFELFTQTFKYTDLDNPHVNFDEHIRNVIIGNYRNTIFRICDAYANRIVSLQSMMVNTANQDSLAVPFDPAKARQEIVESQQRISELMDLMSTRIPPSVIRKPLALRMTEIPMLEKAGMQQEFLEATEETLEAAIEELRSLVAMNVNLTPNNLPLRACLIAIQYYESLGMTERAEALAQTIQAETNLSIGFELLQQMRQQ
ncbi:DUF2723 domain-containing protein [Pontibacter sp. G13]|uniref:glycosyltransferase family 117 protein n=1 Tax=Pontibacter sp. G13 TaxID=3074898 RepID=UPI00288A16F4|nr:DUF2723 domain-containing protein [Pontibacter sp. G13]WNJ21480.1 DUF2723 domain-containing protein [Pontibacter sp. G13]